MNMSTFIKAKRSSERGITLMLSLLVLMALTFSAMALMYFAGYDTDVSSNVALNAAALQATDVGVQTASLDLHLLPAYPETLNMGAYPWWDATLPLSSSGIPVPGDPQNSTNPQFWATCGGVNPAQCGSVPVQFAGRTLTVNFVIEPTGLRPQVLNGSQIVPGSGGPTTTYMVYDAFVNVQGAKGSNLSQTVEVSLRKGG